MRRGLRGGRGRDRPREGARRQGSEGEGRSQQDRHVGHVRERRQEVMTETREQLFARLEALGFEKVSEMRNRGILDGEPAWDYEWLEERSIKRLDRSEEHTSELQSPCNLVCRLLLEKKKKENEY